MEGGWAALVWGSGWTSDRQAHGVRATYVDILGALGPLNQDRGRSKISYSSLWVHSKRHYEMARVVAYWSRRMDRDLRKALVG